MTVKRVQFAVPEDRAHPITDRASAQAARRWVERAYQRGRIDAATANRIWARVDRLEKGLKKPSKLRTRPRSVKPGVKVARKPARKGRSTGRRGARGRDAKGRFR